MAAGKTLHTLSGRLGLGVRQHEELELSTRLDIDIEVVLHIFASYSWYHDVPI
jgi:hypothetical protein